MKYLTFKRFLTVFAALLVILSCTPGKLNITKNGQPAGLWITYYDSAKTRIIAKGKFKNGIQNGKWTYYSPSGIKERTEIYHREDIHIKGYHDNGKIALKGRAKIVTEKYSGGQSPEKIHFYYYGQWKYYFSNGKLQKLVWFDKGNLIREEYKFKSDSKESNLIIKEIRQIEKDYTKYRDTLNVTKKKFGVQSETYQLLKKLESKNDSNVFLRIDKIISKYGYPGKKLAGENNGIIFFIVSTADWPVKEKYLEIFKSAVLKNELSARDLAYFEDKLLVAKMGSQSYGTQYKLDPISKKEVFYPINNLSGMNERRVKAGLEVVNLLDYSEKK